MNITDLENLTYPMFETTEEEKEILRESLQFSGVYTHLCSRISEFPNHANLKRKIQDSLSDYPTLETWFTYNGGVWYDYIECGDKVRDIWTQKLLDYKGNDNA